MPAASPAPPSRSARVERLHSRPFSVLAGHERRCGLVFVFVFCVSAFVSIYVAVTRSRTGFQFSPSAAGVIHAGGRRHRPVVAAPPRWHDSLTIDNVDGDEHFAALAACGTEPIWLMQYLNAADKRKQWLMWEPSPHSGLGQTLSSMSAAFLLAVITNRNFLVSWRDWQLDDGEHLTDYLAPHLVDWLRPLPMEASSVLANSPESALVICATPSDKESDSECAEFALGTFEQFLEKTYSLTEHLDDYTFVRLKDFSLTSDQVVGRLCANPSLLPEFQRAGLHVSCHSNWWDSCALRTLLKPEGELVDKVCGFQQDEFGLVNRSDLLQHPSVLRPYRPGVALHFRTNTMAWPRGNSTHTPPTAEFSAAEKDALRRVSRCAQSLSAVLSQSQDGLVRDSFAFFAPPFIASDSQITLADLDYGDGPPLPTNGSAFVNNSKRQPLLEAVADFALLSQAGVVIGSHGSAFSLEACSLGRLQNRCRVFCTPFLTNTGDVTTTIDCAELPPQPEAMCAQWATDLLKDVESKNSFLAAPFIRCQYK